MKIFDHLLHVFILVQIIDVFWWAITLNKHAQRMKFGLLTTMCGGPDRRECARKNWFRVYFASVSAIFYGLVCSLWLLSIYDHTPRDFTTWMVIGFLLSIIHYSAIIARCTDIQIDEWPWVSKMARRSLSRLFGNEL